jgi:cytochrome P450
MHGVTIPAECKIALLTGSAGRDEREYPDADRFDVRRTFSRHASFGYGPHFCLGAALARLEARVALEETLARFPTWDIDEAGLRWVHTSTVRGYETVPFTP